MPNFIPPRSSLSAEAAAASESVEKFVGDAARGAVESIAHDAATVVAKDASVGARVEAGANLAADVGAIVAGPEELGAERAGLFAIKEGIQHAPQLRALAEALGKEAMAAAPEEAETVGAAFRRTTALLADAGHEITDSHAAKGIIETKNAIYNVIEKGAEVDYQRLGASFNEARENSKNFVIHAPDLEDTAKNAIKAQGYAGIAAAHNVKTTLATSEMSIAKSIGEMERGNGILEKIQDHRISAGDMFSVAGNVAGKLSAAYGLYEAAEKTPIGKAVEKKVEQITADMRHDAVTAVHAGEHAAQAAAKHVRSDVDFVESTGVKAFHAVEDATHEAGQHMSSAVQHAAAEVKKWSPDMPFHEFEKLLNNVRGGVAPQAHEPAISRAPANGIGH